MTIVTYWKRNVIYTEIINEGEVERMAIKKLDKKEGKETTSLVGTAIGVGFVGVVILISYLTLYGFYLDRV